MRNELTRERGSRAGKAGEVGEGGGERERNSRRMSNIEHNPWARRGER